MASGILKFLRNQLGTTHSRVLFSDSHLDGTDHSTPLPNPPPRNGGKYPAVGGSWYLDIDGDGLVDSLGGNGQVVRDFESAFVHFTRRYPKGESLPGGKKGPAQIPFVYDGSGAISLVPTQNPFPRKFICGNNNPPPSVGRKDSSIWGCEIYTRFFYVDINGDSLVDLVTYNLLDGKGFARVRPGDGQGHFGCDSSKQPWPCLPSDGNATTAYEIEIVGSYNSPNLYDEEIYFHDVSGDGLADLIKYDISKGDVILWINQDGHAFACATETCVVGKVMDLERGTFDIGEHRTTFADMNADGTDDLVILAKPGAYVGYFMKTTVITPSDVNGRAPKPGLLTRIHNGYGATTDIQYETIQELDLKARESQRPWRHHSPSVASVVTKITTRDSSTAVNKKPLQKPFGFARQIQYVYRDPAYDRWARSFVGFRKVFTRQGNEQAATVTTYWFGPCQNDALDAQINNSSPLCPEGSDDDIYKSLAGRVARIDRVGLGVFPELSHYLWHEESGPANYLWTKTFQYGLSAVPKSSVSAVIDKDPLDKGVIPAQDHRQITFAWPAKIDTYLYDDSKPTKFDGKTLYIAGAPIEGGDKLESPLHQEGIRKHVSNSVEYDLLGNLKKTREEGVVVDEDSKPEDKGDEVTITLFSPNDPSDSSDAPTKPLPCTADWQCVPNYISVWKPARSGAHFWEPDYHDTLLRKKHFMYHTNTYDVKSVEGWLQGSEALERKMLTETDNMVAPDPPEQSLKTGWHVLAMLNYDVLGNVTQIKGPSGTNGQPLNCSTITYEKAYEHLPNIVRSFKEGCSDAALETTTVFDRGFGQPTHTVAPNGAASAMRLDPFGRPVAIYMPDPDAPPGKKLPILAATIDYSDQSPLSYIDVRHIVGQNETSTRTVTIQNGLGESILDFDQNGTSWILSGWSETNLSGRIKSKQLPWIFNDDPIDTALNAKYITPPSDNHLTIDINYDAFGRQSFVWENGRDNGSNWSVKQSTRNYFPLAIETRDAEQLKTGGPHEKAFQRVEFDGRGRATRSVQHLTQPHDEDIVTNIVYQPTGEPKAITRSHDGGATYRRTMKYDSFGRLVHNAEPNTGNNWRYVWDLAGRLVGTSDARGCGKNIYYDGLSRVLGEDYSPCLASHPAYSPPNLANGEGLETIFRYDTYEAGQMSPESGFADDDRNALGNLVAVLDRGSHTRFNYDARDQVRRISRQIAKPEGAGYEPHWYAQRSDYDVGDRLIRRTTGVDIPEFLRNGSSEERYTYSERGLPYSIDSSYGLIMDRALYGTDGAPSQIAYGDQLGTHSGFEYDSRRRLTRLQLSTVDSGPDGLPLIHYDYHFSAYDEVGNPLVIEDRSPLGPHPIPVPPYAAPVQKKALEYDDLYRLTGIDYRYKPSGGIAPWLHPFEAEVKTNDRRPVPLRDLPTRVANQTYAYDGLGNITASSDDLSARYDRSLGADLGYGTETNGPNQLISGEGLNVRYDLAGNLSELKIERPGQCSDGAHSRCAQWFAYDWDEVGQLARARRWDFDGNAIPSKAADSGALPTGKPDWDISYAYSMGGRIRKSVTDDAGEPRHTLEVFDTLRLERVPFYSDEGIYKVAPEHVHAYPGGIAHVFWDTQGHRGHLAGNSKLVMHLVLGDHLGSSSVVINHTTGELVEQTNYQPYGAVESDYRPERWKSFREDYKFTGKEEDIEVGATYFGARYYQPYLGRFMSADPLTIHGLGSDLNPYAYVGGRVLNTIDPLGLDSCGDDNAKTVTCPGGYVVVKQADGSYEIDPPSPTKPESQPKSPAPKEQEPKTRDWIKFERGDDPRSISPWQRPHTTVIDAEGNLRREVAHPENPSFGKDWGPYELLWGQSLYSGDDETGLVILEGGAGSPAKLIAAIAARANMLHKLAKGIDKFRDLNPLVILKTKGPTLVARGPTRGLSLAQRAALAADEEMVLMRPDNLVPRAIRIHPDIRVLVNASRRGLTPLVLAVAGRPFCPYCIETIEAFSGKLISPGIAVFIGLE